MAANAEEVNGSSNLLADGDMFVATIAGCVRPAFSLSRCADSPFLKDLGGSCRL